MLDQKYLRAHPEEVAECLQKKNFKVDLSLVVQLDEKRRKMQIELESLQSESKKGALKFTYLKKNGESVAAHKSAMSTLKEKMKNLEGQLKEVQNALTDYLASMPNLPAEIVPFGADESENKVIETWGKPTEFAFEPKDHVALGAHCMGLDFELAAKLSGARFVVMRGQVARLHRALSQFMLDVHSQEHGYEEVCVPYLVNAKTLYGTGQLPKFEKDLFRATFVDEEKKPLYLIPTAEVPLTNFAQDKIFDACQLPIKLTAHTACFRSEAGSYGRDVKGMIRQHQFEKVELVQLVKPEESEQALEELTKHAEVILQKLQLPYRKVLLCGGDLGFSATKTYDLEVWLPSQRDYREISSCSSCGDFQARRIHARWRNPKSPKPELVHTLNGSGLAVGRTLIAVLENYQDALGKIHVPEVLIPYLNGVRVIK